MKIMQASKTVLPDPEPKPSFPHEVIAAAARQLYNLAERKAVNRAATSTIG